MKLFFTAAFCFISLFNCAILTGSNLEISNVRFVNHKDLEEPPRVIFDVKWDNSWHNLKNNDAIWLFCKYDKYPWAHPKVSESNHRILQNRIVSCPDPVIKSSADKVGVWLELDRNYRGQVDLRVEIVLDTVVQNFLWNRVRNFQVFGLEMVKIPGGSFYLGDESPYAEKYATFYKSDGSGKKKGNYLIENENEIKVGQDDDMLYYWSEYALYNGDQSGPVPAAFPKGFDPFYIMKYELTQGEYVDFLNQISSDWTYDRNPIGGMDYYDKKGTIVLENKKYRALEPDRPMNFISFTDGLAYTDWAGLRPFTELEFTKAARGPELPKSNEFPWGNDSYADLERRVDTRGNTVFSNGIQEADLSDETRPIYGASFYWVMDLSGSLWEKVITIGNPIGRSFEGSHGDGLLKFGNATNEDWPQSDDEEGGFGYRGGGYYDIGTEYSVFNPHSPIGFRYYDAWSGGPRSIAYGYRAARSAD